MTPVERFAVRRVLVACGPSTGSQAALEGAVDLAAHLGADLEGLFVEDAALLGLSALPFVREVTRHGTAARPLERASLEREMRVLALRTERCLAAAAVRQRVRFAFRTARGQVGAEIVAAASSVDLLVLESHSRPFGREARLEDAVRNLVAATARPVLLVRPERAPAGPVYAAVEQAGSAARVVSTARALAARYRSRTVIALIDGDAELEATVAAALAQEQEQPDLVERRPVDPSATAITGLLREIGTGTLVLSVASPSLATAAAWNQVAEAPCAVLLVP